MTIGVPSRTDIPHMMIPNMKIQFKRCYVAEKKVGAIANTAVFIAVLIFAG